MGGSSRRFNGFNFPATHTEITTNIKNVDAIYYTDDPTLRNVRSEGAHV